MAGKGKTKFVYHHNAGGAVLASLEQRDPEYEKRLDRAGIDFNVTEMAEADAPRPEDLHRAAVRGGVVQVDREDVRH